MGSWFFLINMETFCLDFLFKNFETILYLQNIFKSMDQLPRGQPGLPLALGDHFWLLPRVQPPEPLVSKFDWVPPAEKCSSLHINFNGARSLFQITYIVCCIIHIYYRKIRKHWFNIIIFIAVNHLLGTILY